jgi:5-methylcytosine-specific restriction enzyme subunit McrC
MSDTITFIFEHSFPIPLSECEFSSCKGRQNSLQLEYFEKERQIKSSYFIGVDWIIINQRALYVQPKLNEKGPETDYIKMLFACLKHPDIAAHTTNLYGINFNEPFIELDQKQDMLTPLLVVHFLQVMKAIVRKGLKKSFYNIDNNLNARIKGKINIAQTLKQNVFKNNPLKTFCQYDEFGLNCLENRLLKHTLLFVKKFIHSDFINCDFNNKYLLPVFNFIISAFQEVDENIDIKAIKGFKNNAFYKEYDEALRLANLILKRYGYNIKKVGNAKSHKVDVPPFWIDMAKLFEFYVLGQLKDKYANKILYGAKEARGKYGLTDYLLLSDVRMIIDAKYKPLYQENRYDPDNIRQLSGYGRDKGVLSKLGFSNEQMENTVVDCLIIYPDQSVSENLFENDTKPIEGFVKFFKKPVKLPQCI